MAACPARLLVVGDRIQIGDTVLDVTAVYPLPGRVELSFIGLDCRVSSEVLDPETEVTLIHSATEALVNS